MQLTYEDCTEPHATNESEDAVSHQASPTVEEVAKEKDTPHVIEEFNVEEERKLSAAVDIEALREQDTDISQPMIESDEFSPIPMPLLPSY